MTSKLHVFRCAALALALPLVATFADELDPSTSIEPAPDAASGSAGPSVTDTVLLPVERTILATHPLFHYAFTEAKGVLSSPGASQTTTIQSASVALNWNLGDYLTFRYIPTWTLYSNKAFDDTLGHQAQILMRRSFVDWNVQASDHYTYNSIPLVETGRQTTQEKNIIDFEAQRALGPRTTLELGIDHALRTAQNFSAYREWATNDWLHYQVTSEISASVGVGYGYIDVDDSPSMTYRQLRGRIRWHISEKIVLDARAGYETRDFASSQVGSSSTPVYGLRVRYRPLDTTTVSIDADRSVTPSYFQAQVDRTTNWEVDLNQRLLGRFYADVAFVRRTAAHQSDVAGVIAGREDDGRTWKGRLTTHIRRNIVLAAFYQTKRNGSNDARYDFDGHQFGFEFTFRY